MPTRIEVIQALRSRDEFQNRDVAQILDYIEQEAGNSSGTRALILGAKSRTLDAVTRRDLTALHDYISELGTPATSLRDYLNSLDVRRDIVSRDLVNLTLDVVDGATFPLLLPSNPVVHYNPSDLSTLWQDTGRTMQVTADAQDINAIDGLGSLSGQNMDTLTGTDNAPLFVANAFSFGGNDFAGIEFDASNTEALRNPLGEAPDVTQGGRVMVVAQLLGLPSGIGYPVTMASEEWGSLRMDATNIRANGINAVISQTFAHTSTPVVCAMWIDINVVGSNYELSLSLVAGTDSTTKNITDPNATHEWMLGNRLGASFADNCRVLEVAAWDETLGPPSTGDIEAYVTDRYGIAWA